MNYFVRECWIFFVLYWIAVFGLHSKILEEDLHIQCSHRCPFQNNSESGFDVNCARNCKIDQDIPASNNSDFYMFQNLNPNTNYTLSVAMRNAVGEGPVTSVRISTPPEPLARDAVQPILILRSRHHVIRQVADMLDVPVVVYKTDKVIEGIAIHVRKNLLFVSDSDGYISVTTLREFGRPRAILGPSDTSFKPLDLFIDWLNQHLYMLAEVAHTQGPRWQIARCGLDGRMLTIAVAGILSQPKHIEVDPYNGYLFWVIQGPRGGLFRLDLADISNGIKHEVIPDQIMEYPDLGAFTVDHMNFCVLVPNHTENTVNSVSLDGREVINIRANTRKPMFHDVISLVMVSGLFYWTNGEKLLAEDYHEGQDTYFHNYYPGPSNSSYITVSVDLPTSQPVPVPVNPPIHVQAVLGGQVAKINWNQPHLLGGQGKGAWQNWSYELQVRNEKTGQTNSYSDIYNQTCYTLEDLQDDTEYIIRTSAYTTSGTGPWSTEFRGKTLKAEDNEYAAIVWSSEEGLLKSDVTGEEVVTLIHPSNMKGSHGDYYIKDITYVKDKLFLVSNTSEVFWYNISSHEKNKIHHLDSVGSLAVDWIGKKLYWSNPKQQLISRGNFDGHQQEPLPILTVAKELRVDSEQAYIYWSTGHAVECARLNGDSRRAYYPAELFSGKQVMGLTLNMDERLVYWIVRSYEGSNLYKAPMAETFEELTTLEADAFRVSSLQYPNIQGPLCYFSDHLLWLQDDRNAVISDLTGHNTAVISGVSLSGLHTVAVLDPALSLESDVDVHVIPHPVDPSSLQVTGTWSHFNITWTRVQNVNFGQVYYNIKVDNQEYVLTDNFLTYGAASQLKPYSKLDVMIRAFTYWGGSTHVRKMLHSPPARPSAPTNVRVFVEMIKNPVKYHVEIMGIVRWDPPAHPNGVVRGYKIKCWVLEDDNRLVDVCNQVVTEHMEFRKHRLLHNVTYTFQVQAFTSAGEGELTDPVDAETSQESPVPRLLVSTTNSVRITDCDLRQHRTLSVTAEPPLDMSFSSYEGKLFWLNDMMEMLSSSVDGSHKTKIFTLNGTGQSIAVDWVGRFVYWSETNERVQATQSTIYKIDLNRFENGIVEPEVVLTRSRKIRDIEISPFTKLVYWLEHYRGSNVIMRTRVGERGQERPLFAELKEGNCNCSKMKVRGLMSFDQSDPYRPKMIFTDESRNVVEADSDGCRCRMLLTGGKGLPPTALTTDEKHIYWSNQTESKLYYVTKDRNDSKQQEMIIDNIKNILAFGTYLQPYPAHTCLTPQQVSGSVLMLKNKSTALVLQLPKPEGHHKCANVSQASIEYKVYYGPITEDGTSECLDDLKNCKTMSTYQTLVEVTELKPYSTYVFMVSLKNYYSLLTDETPLIGPPSVFKTSAGAPTPPQNVTVRPIDPNSIEVKWLPPKEYNDETVSYEIHWRTEGSVVRQGQAVIEDAMVSYDLYRRGVIGDLLAGQVYLIWVRAKSNNSDSHSDSDVVTVRTYPLPNNITLITATPTSLTISWISSSNITMLSYGLQYFDPNYDIWRNVDYVDDKFFVDNLTPKTLYKFRVVLLYPSSDLPYIWPSDGRFTFETLGDRPSRPGTPTIQQLRRDVYQVLWEPPNDNGAHIELYLLEGLRAASWRIKRETNYTFYTSAAADITQNIVPTDEWVVFYNGTDNYWIISELIPSLKYVFRVKAKNKYGWSDSSDTSKSFDFTEAAMLAEKQPDISIVLATVLPITLVFIVAVTLFVCLCKRRENEKKTLQIPTMTTPIRGPDVELATLRELPRRGNFIQNANILYASSDPPTDEEIALLPHIRRDQFTLTKFLGSGAFGEVYEGISRGLPSVQGAETRVAIKALRKGATEQEKAEFLKEAQLMSHFKHQHILQLVGVCLDNDPNYILMELMEGGDLLSYLRVNRPLINTQNSMTLLDLLSMCVDVATGCRYLEEMHFVHRDLACRNCLVSSVDRGSRIVKIGDFGLARDIYKNDYYRKEGEGLLPVRWMAPESLVDGVFTSQSDVWAFGVLTWEIMTLGQQPYPARTNLEVLHYVRTGGRLGRPNNCPEELHQLMFKCWSFNPENRPTFKYCLETLQTLKSKTTNIPLTSELVGSYLEVRTGTLRKSETPELDQQTQEPIIQEEQIIDSSISNRRYLELVYDSDVVVSDGYEVPRLNKTNESVSSDRTRTLSTTSSEASTSSQQTVPLVDNEQKYSSKRSNLSSLTNGSVPNKQLLNTDSLPT